MNQSTIPTIAAVEGETFEVQLSGNATTGHTWVVVANDDPSPITLTEVKDHLPSGLNLTERKYVGNTSEKNAVGQGGVFVFTFKRFDQKEYYLHFFYGRPWEKTPLKERKIFRVKS